MVEHLESGHYPFTRLRRMRADSFSRTLMRESTLSVDDLIQPLFVREGDKTAEPVQSMPCIERLSVDRIVSKCRDLHNLGIQSVVLFPVTPSDVKSDDAREAWNPDGLVQRTISAIKDKVPEIGVMTDVALDPYTLNGQDGLVDESGYVMNDATVEALIRQSLSHAHAGADVVAPSDMMDGRICGIRKALEDEGFYNLRILSYAAKYASSFYGPFRDAVGSAANLGGSDKYSYQMDPANAEEALRETALDIQEGADMVMIKPGTPYLDVIWRIREAFGMPTFAYQVSGEYAMFKAAAQNGWIDEQALVLETLLGFKRAGCHGVLTYYAEQAARWLNP
ncbi:MAG: porphobilinogen synthase [Gammaproteobacteria bacterium]|nr:porphobilinogen synthase [Gammaproteobacteria bacterium]